MMIPPEAPDDISRSPEILHLTASTSGDNKHYRHKRCVFDKLAWPSNLTALVNHLTMKHCYCYCVEMGSGQRTFCSTVNGTGAVSDWFGPPFGLAPASLGPPTGLARKPMPVWSLGVGGGNLFTF